MFASLEDAATGKRTALSAILDAIRFDTAGLVPAVAQDVNSGDVLMLAWMNREALEETLATGRACYYSRSRSRLWRKGEESGHVQQLVELRFDCDGDAVLLRVAQRGPACHTGRASCFYLRVEGNDVVVDRDVDVEPDDMYPSS